MDGITFVGLIGYGLAIAVWFLMAVVYVVIEIKERRTTED